MWMHDYKNMNQPISHSFQPHQVPSRISVGKQQQQRVHYGYSCASSDSGGSSTSTSPSPPVTAVTFGSHISQQQQLSPTMRQHGIDSAYVSTNSSPMNGANNSLTSLWSSTVYEPILSNMIERDKSNGRRQLFTEYSTMRQPPSINARSNYYNYQSSGDHQHTTAAATTAVTSSALSPCASSSSSSSVYQRLPLPSKHQQTMRNVFVEPNSGMRDVPMWLKSLRLHKYTTMFQQMTYDQMIALDEQQLETQSVTKGARRKILQSVQKLRERVDFMQQLEKDVNEPGGIRTTLVELRAMIMTPIRPYPLPGCPEPIQAKIDGLNIPSDQIDVENLPAHFVRVLSKVYMAIFESPETSLEDEYFSMLLQIYDRIANHEAFTLAQKQRIMAWKRAVKKVFSPSMPRKRTPATYAVNNGYGNTNDRRASIATGTYAHHQPSTSSGSGGASSGSNYSVTTPAMTNNNMQQQQQSARRLSPVGQCRRQLPQPLSACAGANGGRNQWNNNNNGNNDLLTNAAFTADQIAMLREFMMYPQLNPHFHNLQQQLIAIMGQQTNGGGGDAFDPYSHRYHLMQHTQQPLSAGALPTSRQQQRWPTELSRQNSAPPLIAHYQQQQSTNATGFKYPSSTPSTMQLNQLAASLAIAAAGYVPFANQRRTGDTTTLSHVAPPSLEQKSSLLLNQWPPMVGSSNGVDTESSSHISIDPLLRSCGVSSMGSSISQSDVISPQNGSASPPLYSVDHRLPSSASSSCSSSERSSGAESPPGLMVYNFCGSQMELDKMCRSQMSFGADNSGIQQQQAQIVGDDAFAAKIRGSY